MKIVINGSGDDRLDGDYTLDGHPFTNREWHMIKQVSGIRVAEFMDALANADNDLVVAIAQVALRRAGKNIPVDVLWDMEGGKITLDLEGDEDEEAGGAANPQPTPQPNDEPGSGELKVISSGDGSSTPSENQESDRSSTGIPPSGIGRMSA